MFGDQVKYSFKRKIGQLTLIGFTIIFLATACRQEKTPDGILSSKQMVSVLTDIYLTEEKAGRAITSRDSLLKVFPKFEARIFEKAGVPDSVFRKSMEYYMANPTKLEYIYTALVDSLNLKSQSAPSTHVE